MRKRNTPKEKLPNVKRERDPIPWRYCLLALFCGLLLATGFFWAARQHFGALAYAMKNAELGKEIKSLKDEERRLKGEKEDVRHPLEVIKRAQKQGMVNLAVETLATVADPIEKPATTENPKPNRSEKIESAPKIKKAEVAKIDEKAKETKVVKDKSGEVKTTESRPQVAKK